jgi:Na+/proline symporter
MLLSNLDWTLIFVFFAITLFIGIWTSKRSGKSYQEFFLSGRSMPWWLLGISMVATTFSADTPNLVTDIVRRNGVSGNWVWWAFLLTGMLTVFVYAKLWRRSGILTDLEFYELRYSGKAAAFLRAFRAIYLGFFFNIMIMATVTLAAIKIGGVLLGLSPLETILITGIITVIYTSLGGLRGVLLTDFFQFAMAMVGTVWAAIEILSIPKVNGLSGLLAHEDVVGKLNLIPDFNDINVLIPLLILPLAIQWWSVWYPGAEPGGGGYIAQRMLSAKNEKNAIGATLLFNIAHYALRPWPWIIIALASLIVFPMTFNPSNSDQIVIHKDAQDSLSSVKEEQINYLLQGIDSYTLKAETTEDQSKYTDLKNTVSSNLDNPVVKSLATIFYQKNIEKEADVKQSDPLKDAQLTSLYLANPQIPISKLGHDMAYPAMLSYLPKGLLGLVLASLIAAFMSTISTHLNWGSSYLVHDVYRRFLKPDASDKSLVFIGRICTVVLMICSALVALLLHDALGAFNILLQIGAGTGLIFILRWFWWRVNAYSEITAMIVSFVIAVLFEAFNDGTIASHYELLIGIGATTFAWMLVTFLTKPTDYSTLLSFYKKIKPHSIGWKKVVNRGIEEGEMERADLNTGKLPREILCMVSGCFAVYALLFSTGFWIYGEFTNALLGTVVAIIAGYILIRNWGKVID